MPVHESSPVPTHREKRRKKMERNDDEIGMGNGKAETPTEEDSSSTPNDGSIAGFESLHRLLCASLSPQVFQVYPSLSLSLK